MHGYHKHTWKEIAGSLATKELHHLILELEEHLHKPLLSNCMRYVKWILMYLVIAHVILESTFDCSQYLRLRSDL